MKLAKGLAAGLVWVALFLALVSFLFPINHAFKNGFNPVISSQLGKILDPKSQLQNLVFMPYTGFHVIPNLDETGTFSGQKFHFRTNNWGFLTPYPLEPYSGAKLKKSENDRLVLLTGGSAAFGLGASSNENTISYQLEGLLNQEDKSHHWYVLNLGMSTWIAYQEAIALDLFGYDLEPDWVVTLDGRNDFMVPTTSGERVPNFYFYQAERKLNDLFSGRMTSLQKAFPFLKYRELSHQLDEIAKKPPPVTAQEEIEKAARFYVHSIEMIVSRFNRQHIILMTQPTFGLVKRDPAGQASVIQAGLKLSTPLMTQLAARHPNVQYTDGTFLLEALGEKGFLDDCHMTDVGQSQVAQFLSKRILSQAH